MLSAYVNELGKVGRLMKMGSSKMKMKWQSSISEITQAREVTYMNKKIGGDGTGLYLVLPIACACVFALCSCSFRLCVGTDMTHTAWLHLYSRLSIWKSFSSF